MKKLSRCRFLLHLFLSTSICALGQYAFAQKVELTWQSTVFREVATLSAVSNCLDSGVLIGGTMKSGQAVVFKLNDHGDIIWKLELPVTNPSSVIDLQFRKEDDAYYFLVSEGHASYTTRSEFVQTPGIPTGGTKPKVLSLAFGSISASGTLNWIFKQYIPKGMVRCSPTSLAFSENYMLIAGGGVKKDSKTAHWQRNGFLLAIEPQSGKFVKNWVFDQPVHQVCAYDNYWFVLKPKRSKKFHAWESLKMDASLKVISKESTQKLNTTVPPEISVCLAAKSPAQMHLITRVFTNNKNRLAFGVLPHDNMINPGVAPVGATNFVNTGCTGKDGFHYLAGVEQGPFTSWSQKKPMLYRFTADMTSYNVWDFDIPLPTGINKEKMRVGSFFDMVQANDGGFYLVGFLLNPDTQPEFWKVSQFTESMGFFLKIDPLRN